MTYRTLLAIDTETHLIGKPDIIPKFVCATFAWLDFKTGERGHAILSNGDEGVEQALYDAFSDPDIKLLFHVVEFDLSVIAIAFPRLIPVIFKALDECRVTDTKVREQLLNLSRHGRISKLYLENGAKQDIKYTLAALIQKYRAKDRSDAKSSNDSWRLNYKMLDGIPSAKWPQDAIDYAIEDADDTLDVYLAQEKSKDEEFGSTTTEELQTYTAFCLKLMTAIGFETDAKKIAKIKEELATKLSDEKLKPLYDAGILRPAVAPKQKKDGTMTAGKPPSRDMKALRQRIKDACAKIEMEVPMTDGSDKKEPEVCTDDEVLTDLVGVDPILDLYHYRQEWIKLQDTELPRISHPVVSPSFNVLVETGRTSSKEDKLFPSMNGQNVDPRVRPVFTAREGKVLCSIDYSGIELASLAQKNYSLFGHSVLRELLLQDVDLHAYLGSILAIHLDSAWANTLEAEGVETPMQAYSAFQALKKNPQAKAFFSKYRGLAKPTGLGYPGGLGAKRFVNFAKTIYGVDLVEMTGSWDAAVEMAKMLKKIWLDTFPEMQDYFKWIVGTCEDPRNLDAYAYLSPLGMYRANCSYTAACNGAALQTPTAEGAKLGVIEVMKACWNPETKSILYGSRPLDFIHDEQIIEMEHSTITHEMAFEAARIMQESMKGILTDVPVKATPVLMQEWHKEAEQVFDSNGRLAIWKPK